MVGKRLLLRRNTPFGISLPPSLVSSSSLSFGGCVLGMADNHPASCRVFIRSAGTAGGQTWNIQLPHVWGAKGRVFESLRPDHIFQCRPI